MIDKTVKARTAQLGFGVAGEGSFAWDQVPQQEVRRIAMAAMARALEDHRRIAISAAWGLTVLGVVITLVVQHARDIPSTALMVIWSFVGFQAGYPVLMHFLPSRYVYQVIHAWIINQAVLVISMLAYFLFGPEKNIILSGISPLLLPVLPVFIIVIRAFLMPHHARQVVWASIIGLGLVAGVHAVLNWQTASTVYGMVLSLVTVGVLCPLAYLMLELHIKIQRAGILYLAQANAQARMDAMDAHRHRLVDATTGILKEEAARAAIQLALVSGPRTALAEILISNGEAVRQAGGESAFQNARQELSNLLLSTGVGDLSIGVKGEDSFLLWSREEIDERQWSERIANLVEGLRCGLQERSSILVIRHGAACFDQYGDAAFAIEEVAFRCFMQEAEA